MANRTIERISISQVLAYVLLGVVALVMPDRRSGNPRVRHKSPNIVPESSEDGFEPASANAVSGGEEQSSEKVEQGLWPLFKTAALQWLAHKASRMGAALAYYSVFSIGPLILIAVAIAGLLYGREAVQGQVTTALQDLLGENGAQAINGMLQSADRPAQGIVATIVGVVTLLFAAIGVVVQLKDAFNTVWEVDPEKQGGVWGFVRTYIMSLAGVLAVGFLLLVSMLLTAVLAAFGKYIGTFVPESVIQIAGFLVSFAVIALLFAMMFKWLPDAPVRWADVWLGAVLTAALFEIGKFLIGLYIGKQGLESTYGAASSLVVILIWVYYSAQLVLLGAEFTNVRAKQRGYAADAKPQSHA